MTAVPRLTIVIVTYNSRAHLAACLGALSNHPPAASHEIVIVDNASPDGTAAFVRERWPGVRLIESGANLGFARANNLAIRATSSELVLLLNPDTIVRPAAIDRLIAVLDASPEVAVVGPRILDAEGRAELSFGPMIGPLAELRQKALVRAQARQWPVLSAYVERLTRRAGFPDWVSGACLLIRRADLETAGLLDERFFLYTEDVDLCAAVRARARRVRFSPDAEVEHARGASRATAPAATEAAYRRSQLAFYEKHHPHWAPILRAYLKIRGRKPDTSMQGQ